MERKQERTVSLDDYIPVIWPTPIRMSRGTAMTIEELTEVVQLLTDENTSLEKQKNQAYRERDMLLAVWCRFIHEFASQNMIRVYRALHDENDKEWEQDWRNIIVVEYLLPQLEIDKYGNKERDVKVIQMTWHIHDKELRMFSYLPLKEYIWDGHDTMTKYGRLLDMAIVTIDVQFDMLAIFKEKEQ